jgi:hypothetical protein
VFRGEVTIAPAVGKGTAITTSGGTPTYGSVDYMGPDYQVFDGVVTAVGAGDVGYTPPTGFPTNSLSNLDRSQLVISEQILTNQQSGDLPQTSVQDLPSLNSFLAPETIMGEITYSQLMTALQSWFAASQQRFINLLAANASWVRIELADLTSGEWEREVPVDTTVLTIPKQMDLG